MLNFSRRSVPLAIDYAVPPNEALCRKSKTKTKTKNMSEHPVPFRHRILFSVPEFPV